MIKKVVIPSKNITYVCELSEKDFKIAFGMRQQNEFGVGEFAKQETVKPITDDEVSIEDFKTNNIYAYKSKLGNNILYFDSLCITGDNLNIKRFINGGLSCEYDVYEFSGENKQQEFFEWALKQLEGSK